MCSPTQPEIQGQLRDRGVSWRRARGNLERRRTGGQTSGYTYDTPSSGVFALEIVKRRVSSSPSPTDLRAQLTWLGWRPRRPLDAFPADSLLPPRPTVSLNCIHLPCPIPIPTPSRTRGEPPCSHALRQAPLMRRRDIPHHLCPPPVAPVILSLCCKPLQGPDADC